VIQNTLLRPWWKEPMVWLVAGLPATAVVASFTTYYIAATNPDPLVNLDNPKFVVAPDNEIARERRAAALGIVGEMVIVEGNVSMRLSGRLNTMPASLEWILMDATQAVPEVRVQLQGDGNGLFMGRISETLSGNKQWILEPSDQVWRLAGGLVLPLDGSFKLESNEFNNNP
jgi:uncharacterized protein